ncbi:hypothetical protein ACFE04_006069 [Oxalis oulophora]
MINHICRSSVDFGFCYKVFHANLKSPSTDLVGLSRIIIDEGANNASNNLEHVADLLHHETDPNKQYLLSHCVYGYDGAFGSFKVASDALDQGKFPDVLHDVRQGPYQLRQCIGVFATDPDIGQRNIIMENLMTMAIITAINLNDQPKIIN